LDLSTRRDARSGSFKIVLIPETRAGESAISKERLERPKEHGGARAKTILTLFIVGALIFAGVKIVPVYVTNYQFNDAMGAEARFALSSFPKKTEMDIQDDLYKEAMKDGLNIKHDDIKVQISGSLVNITLDYTVPIDLKVYLWQKNFHLTADNHTI
jgi:hypothetical protein